MRSGTFQSIPPEFRLRGVLFSLIILQVSATMEAAGCGWSEGEIAQRVGVVFEQRGQHRGALVIVLPGSR